MPSARKRASPTVNLGIISPAGGTPITLTPGAQFIFASWSPSGSQVVYSPLRKVLVEVFEEVRAAGAAVVTVEHDMEYVAQVCDHVVVLDEGAVIARCALDGFTPTSRWSRPTSVGAGRQRGPGARCHGGRGPRRRGGYGDVRILNGIDTRVDAPEIVTVLGPNGSGKSTLMKAIAGFVRLSGGRVLLDGAEIQEAPCATRVLKHRLAYVPQRDNVFPGFSVAENLAAGSVKVALTR